MKLRKAKALSVWIIEMWNSYNDRWVPCSSCGLTREEVREDVKDWKFRNPCDKFRLRKYARVEIKEVKR